MKLCCECEWFPSDACDRKADGLGMSRCGSDERGSLITRNMNALFSPSRVESVFKSLLSVHIQASRFPRLAIYRKTAFKHRTKHGDPSEGRSVSADLDIDKYHASGQQRRCCTHKTTKKKLELGWRSERRYWCRRTSDQAQ